MTEAPRPSTGRIVHYVSHGTPVQPDGSQAFTSECRAAIVTEVMGDPMESVGLCVLNPTGQFFNRAVPHDEDGHSGGSWHWPERTNGREITEPAPARRAEIREN